MENGTKALLIAASVLITIVLIATGVILVRSGTNSNKHASDVGNKISSTTQGIVGNIEANLNGKTEPKIAIADLTIKHDKDGGKLNITGVPEDELGKVTYSSADTTIAEVDDKGYITRKEAGITTVTATYKEVSSTCIVTVQPKVTSLKIKEKNISLNVRDRYTILVETEPTRIDEGLRFKDYNPSIVQIESSGMMEAVAPGETYVTVIYGNLSDTCRIEVTGGYYE